MIIKFGKSTIAQTAESPDVLLRELPNLQLATGMQKRLKTRIAQFDPIRLAPDKFLYIRNRSISADETWGPNMNFDGFVSAELQTGHPTFAGAMLDIDHDPSLPIGQVLDSYMIPKAVCKRQDDKEGSKAATLVPFMGYDHLEAGDQVIGDWVENVWAIEKQAIDTFYPGAVEAIRDGEITDTSMGCEIAFSKCNICNNKAVEPTEYCQHIGIWGVNKGSVWPHPVLGHDVVSYERCYGVRFFEDSLIMPESWNQYPGSQGADISAKILEIFAGKGRADVQARRLAGQLRLVYLRLSDEKRAAFLDILKSID